MLLEARRRMQKVLDEAYEAGKVTEEVVLDGVMALEDAHMWMDEGDECLVGFERAKGGFEHLLGENSAKAVNVAYSVASQISSDDEEIAELQRLWEMARVSVPDEAVTFNIATDLESELQDKGWYEEAKVFKLAAFEGRRRVLGEEHKDTLASLSYMRIVPDLMKDYEGALDYYQQALRMQEKVLRKTHPDTLNTIMNMATLYMDRKKDLRKAEEMYRLAPDGHEKSLGKNHEDTKICAKN